MHEIDYALGPVWYAAFLLSITCHEAAHALAAKLGGDLTAYAAGQVSLNPIPHIRREPFGTILVPLLSFAFSGWMMGWASAPYSPLWAQRYPRRAAWMALAGPAANFTLAALATVAIAIGFAAGAFVPPAAPAFTAIVAGASPEGLSGGAAVFLSVVFSLNVILGVFNLIPVPPLDGAGALGLLLPDGLMRRFNDAVRTPMFSMLGLLVAWRAAGYVIWPVFDRVLAAVYSVLRLLRP